MMFNYMFLLPRRAKKAIEQQKIPQETWDVDITAEGFSGSGPMGLTNMQWKDFHKYKMGKGLILVYRSDDTFSIFPRRWFSDDEFAQFQNYLRENLGKPKT